MLLIAYDDIVALLPGEGACNEVEPLDCVLGEGDAAAAFASDEQTGQLAGLVGCGIP